MTGIAVCMTDEESKRKGLVWPACDPKQSAFRKKDQESVNLSVSVWLDSRTDGSPLIFSVLINFWVVSVLIEKFKMLLPCLIGLHLPSVLFLLYRCWASASSGDCRKPFKELTYQAFWPSESRFHLYRGRRGVHGKRVAISTWVDPT